MTGDIHGDWLAALALGVRLGVIAPEAAARARERLAANPGASAADPQAGLARVAECAGVDARLLEHLAGVLDLGSRTGGISALAQTVLSGQGASSDAEPTLRLPQDPPSPHASTFASPAAGPPLPNVPRKLGPYELLEPLGHGGMGVVFRARHERLGHLCAVKVLIAGEHASAEAIARFQREAASVAKMGKHPNIVTVHDLGQEGSLVWYAMELVEGMSLRAVLAERDLAPEEAARIVEKVARAVHFAHTKGVIHRDLKPDNIVIGANGEPQVMDFGLALDVSTSARLSMTGDVFGSPNYMAPEQARGEVERSDARTDVYGLGGVLYQALTKLPPHPGRQVAEVLDAVLRGEVLSPRRVRPEVPRDLETVCLKCLESDQARRYATAEALADDLARFLRGEHVLARPTGAVGRFMRRVTRHPLVSTLVAGILALAIGLGWRLLGPARLTVSTDPPDARVGVVGTTLWRGGWIWPARPFTLRVTRDGWLPQEVEVHASPGASIPPIAVTLLPKPGTLELTGTPRGMSVVVWDVDHGQEKTRLSPPATIELEAGRYELSASEKDCFVRRESIGVRRGETIRRNVSLPRQTIWTREIGDGWGGPMCAGDLDGDGLADLVGGTYEGEVYALSGKDGTVLWTRETGGVMLPARSLADLDADGVPDCIVGSSDNRVHALSGRDGAILWERDTGASVDTSPALGDLNGDGCADCVVVSDDHVVHALSGRDGAVLWTFKTNDLPDSSALGDLNGDGTPDCVVGSRDGRVYALTGKNGAPLWVRETGGVVASAPALGDLDQDGVLDCVVGSGKNVVALSGRDGAVLWTRETGLDIHSSPALGDLNGDGCLDSVVGSNDANVYALSGRDGGVLWKTATGGVVAASPALADLDGDGGLECVVGSLDKKVYALSGRDGAPLWTYETGHEVWSPVVLEDLDGDGAIDCVVASRDKKVYALAGSDRALLWAHETEGTVASSPALADLDKDGALDCVVGSNDGRVYALSGRGGSVLWQHDAGSSVRSSPALGDLNADGVLDCVVGSDDRKVYALSGKSGAVLWVHETGDAVGSSPALGDVNGDGVVDCVVGSSDGSVYALSGRNGRPLWVKKTDRPVHSSPALGDLDGDGVPDCVVGSDDGKVYALSGNSGAVLWTLETRDAVESSPALGDLNSDGVLDCVVASEDGWVYAVSGRNGVLLWTYSTGGAVECSPVLGDMDGDGGLDCVVGPCAVDGEVYALSGRKGAVLWTFQTRRPDTSASALSSVSAFTMFEPTPTNASPALADTDGDGRLECVVCRGDGKVYALSGRDGAVLWACETRGGVWSRPALGDLDRDGLLDCVVGSEDGQVRVIAGTDPKRLRAAARRRLGSLRHARWSVTLAELATERLADWQGQLTGVKEPWAQATTWVSLGIARARLGQPKEALDAFAEARRLCLRAPDAAAYEWIASRLWIDCPPERQKVANGVLLDGLGFEPDVVFDTLVEAHDLLPAETRGPLREVLHEAASQPAARIVAPLLLAEFVPQATTKDAVRAARQDLLARLQTGEGDHARCQGYLALIAAVLGEKDSFARLYATYHDLPRRPASLDLLLFHAAERLRGR